MLVYGVIGIAGCQMTYYMAVQDSNAGIATVLQYTAPVMIMVLLAIRNRKLPEGNEILALVLAFGGTVLLATHGNLTQLSVSKTTLVLGLASAVATVFYNLVPGNMMDIYGTFSMVGWGMLISGIGLTPFVQPWTMTGAIEKTGENEGSFLDSSAPPEQRKPAIRCDCWFFFIYQCFMALSRCFAVRKMPWICDSFRHNANVFC